MREPSAPNSVLPDSRPRLPFAFPPNLDACLLLLALVFFVTPLAISGATHNLESVKRFFFQEGTVLLLLAMVWSGRLLAEEASPAAFDRAAILLFVTHAGSMAVSEPAGNGLWPLAAVTYQILFYWLVRQLAPDSGAWRALAGATAAAVLLVSAVAIVQVAGEYRLRYGVLWETRATGTFLQPTFLGAYLAAVLPLLVVGARYARSRASERLYGIAFTAGVTALLLSLSRSGWLGAAAALGVLAWLERTRPVSRRAVLFLGLGIVLGLTVVLLRPPGAVDRGRLDPGGSRSDSERLAIWRGTLAMIAASPFSGVGPGNFAWRFPPFAPPYLQRLLVTDNQRPAHAHSEPLHIAAEVGLLGLAAWVALVALTLRSLLAAARAAESREARSWLHAHVALMAALLVNACIGLDQRFTTSAMLLWYSLGVAASRAKIPSRGESALASVRGGLDEPRSGPGARTPRQPLLLALAVYLLWLPVGPLRADRAKMLAVRHHIAREFPLAAVHLEAAARLAPWDAELHFLRGRNFWLLGNPPLAAAAYETAGRIDRFNPALLFNLAAVYNQIGRPDLARLALTRALAVAPSFEAAARELSRLEASHVR